MEVSEPKAPLMRCAIPNEAENSLSNWGLSAVLLGRMCRRVFDFRGDWRF